VTGTWECSATGRLGQLIAMEIVPTVNDALSLMRPQPCPFDLIRIGGAGDGAYLVPDDLDGIQACFSPGVNNRKAFEDDLARRFGIPSHMCDYSSDIAMFRTPLIEGMQTFTKKWLDTDGASTSISLHDWIADKSPGSADLMLQMDIEGAEVRNLLATPADDLCRFRIIVIELHGLSAARDPVAFARGIGRLLSVLHRHFVCVHARPNNACGEYHLQGCDLNIPEIIEITYLRRDRMSGVEGLPLKAPMLPHPLDIARNVADRPPLFLNDAWNAGPRPDAAVIKELHDRLDFCRHSEARLRAELTTLMRVRDLLLGTIHSAREPGGLPQALTDLAAGKPFTLSGAYPGHADRGIVEAKEPYFFHTGFGINQRITVDLGRQCVIHGIEVRNRTDCCRERAAHLFCELHDTALPAFAATWPLTVTQGFLDHTNVPSTTVLPATRSRYVTIFSPGQSPLHLSVLRILGQC